MSYAVVEYDPQSLANRTVTILHVCGVEDLDVCAPQLTAMEAMAKRLGTRIKILRVDTLSNVHHRMCVDIASLKENP